MHRLGTEYRKKTPPTAQLIQNTKHKKLLSHIYAWIILSNFRERTTKNFFILILYMLNLFDYLIFERNIPPQTPNSIVKTVWFNWIRRHLLINHRTRPSVKINWDLICNFHSIFHDMNSSKIKINQLTNITNLYPGLQPTTTSNLYPGLQPTTTSNPSINQ